MTKWLRAMIYIPEYKQILYRFKVKGYDTLQTGDMITFIAEVDGIKSNELSLVTITDN